MNIRRHISLGAKPKPSKYRNRPVQGYASRKEAKRGAELELLEHAGRIRDLRRQVRYELIPAQYVDGKCVERAVTYTADFCYDTKYDDKGRACFWTPVVEDVKGYPNDRWAIKRKLMLHVHGIRIREV